MFRKGVIGFAIVFCFGTAATAQSFPIDRLSDWKFRFYACKNVVMNAAIVVRLMARHQITDQSGIDEMQSQLGPELVKTVTESEKEYRFTDGEAWFVSDLTFSVVSGMVKGGFELSDLQLIRFGSGICIHTIEGMAQ